jgi:4-guanidinobutyraldehyde dehydrogenase/NAD-dependent aldehyde dehydrogenase
VKFAQLIDQHGEELALLESLDMGKPVQRCAGVDVAASVRCMSWTGEAIDKVYGEVAATGRTNWAWSRASRWAWSARSCRGISRC